MAYLYALSRVDSFFDDFQERVDEYDNNLKECISKIQQDRGSHPAACPPHESKLIKSSHEQTPLRKAWCQELSCNRRHNKPACKHVLVRFEGLETIVDGDTKSLEALLDTADVFEPNSAESRRGLWPDIETYSSTFDEAFAKTYTSIRSRARNSYNNGRLLFETLRQFQELRAKVMAARNQIGDFPTDQEDFFPNTFLLLYRRHAELTADIVLSKSAGHLLPLEVFLMMNDSFAKSQSQSRLDLLRSLDTVDDEGQAW